MTDPSTLLAEVRARLGCVPPVLAGAAAAPAMLSSLWSQTRAAYLDNPLPGALKEQVLGRLALLRDDRYMVAVHALRLHRLGVPAERVLVLLTRPYPQELPPELPDILDADAAAEALAPLADLALVLVRRPDDREARTVAAEVLGLDGLAHLAALLGWAGAQRGWSVGVRELPPEQDLDLAPMLKPLVQQAPAMVRLLRRAPVHLPGNTPLMWYRAILEQSADAMLIADADGHYLDANQAATVLLGYSRAELTALTVADIVARDSGRAAAFDRFPPEHTWIGELALRRRDGTTVMVEARATAIDLPRGTIYVSLCRDISERLRSEAALRESEARFRAMADSAPVLIWIAAPDRSFTYVNRTWLDFTGRSLEEGEAHGWADHIHSDDRLAALAAFDGAMAERRALHIEYRCRRYDGEWRWLLDTAQPMHTADGAFNGFIGSCIDITERRQAEAEQQFLAETSRILSRSVDQQVTLQDVARMVVPFLADMCVAVTIEGDHLRTAGVFHRDPEREAVLVDVMRRFPPTGVLMRANRTAVTAGQTWLAPDVSEQHLQMIAANPDHLAQLRRLGMCSLLITPLTGHSGPYGVLLMALDRPGRRYGEAERRLAVDLAGRAAIAVENGQHYREAVAARLAAEQAGRVRDEFLSVAAHELKTPTASIKGYAQLLRRRVTDRLAPADARALEAINRSADRLSRLVTDLLDVSRLQRDRHALRLELLNLHDLVADAVTQVEGLAPGHQIILTGAEQVPVQADRDRLFQVTINLLANAVKFSPDGGEVAVHITLKGMDAVVSVTDHGVGIPSSAQRRMFERFYRAHPETEGFEGMGVGLYLSREYVELHGGMIWFTSQERFGSTFFFSIPLVGGGAGG